MRNNYVGDESKMFHIQRKLNYEELVIQIITVVRLSSGNELVTKIMCRQFMMVKKFMKYELVELHDDDVKAIIAVILYFYIIRGHMIANDVMGVGTSSSRDVEFMSFNCHIGGISNSRRHEVVTLHNENYNVNNRGINSYEESNSGIVFEYAESEEASDDRDELDSE